MFSRPLVSSDMLNYVRLQTSPKSIPNLVHHQKIFTISCILHLSSFTHFHLGKVAIPISRKARKPEALHCKNLGVIPNWKAAPENAANLLSYISLADVSILNPCLLVPRGAPSSISLFPAFTSVQLPDKSESLLISAQPGAEKGSHLNSMIATFYNHAENFGPVPTRSFPTDKCGGGQLGRL